MDTEDNESRRSILGDYSCKICSVRYVTLQECLKHELLTHSFSKSKSKRKRMKTILDSLQDSNKDLEDGVFAEIDTCQPGEELNTILKLYCAHTEKLEQCYKHIHSCLTKEIRKVGHFSIYPFGSAANGLALKDSDIDIYIQCDDSSNNLGKQLRINFNRVSAILCRSECFTAVIPIRQARVPIIKCKHLPTECNIDINMSCPSSVHNTNFIRDIISRDTRIHQMFLFLKIWSKHLHITGRGGNMNSYCLVTLIIFYLQNTPNCGYGEKSSTILVSMEELQKDIPMNIVEGINYAYNLRKIPALAKHHTPRSLIEGFFMFYRKFNFADNIVSTFWARTIPRSQLTIDSEQFKTYRDQLRSLSILYGGPAKPLQIQHSMCIQDNFCLNLNVGRSITPYSFEYILKCLYCAAKICATKAKQRNSNGEFYKLLLRDVSEQLLASTDPPSENTNIAVQSFSSGSLTFTLMPSRVDMRALVNHLKDIKNDKISLNKLWVRHYVEIIHTILVDIYKLDVQNTYPTHCLKNQKMEDAELTYMWTLNSSVDMWTGRNFEGKNSMLFMKHQKNLTERFQQQRRQSSLYAVQLNALLILNILNDYSVIHLKIEQIETSPADITKKSPLRKFFGNFKTGLQSFNLKEKLSETEKFMKAPKQLLTVLAKESIKIEIKEEDKK